MHVYIDSNLTTYTINELKLLLERNEDPDSPVRKTNIQDDMVYKVFRSILRDQRAKCIKELRELSPELLTRLEFIADDIRCVLMDVLLIDEPFKQYSLRGITLTETLITLDLKENK